MLQKGCAGERDEREEGQKQCHVARVIQLLWKGKLTEYVYVCVY